MVFLRELDSQLTWLSVRDCNSENKIEPCLQKHSRPSTSHIGHRLTVLE